MVRGVSSSAIGACFAFAAFVVAVLAGLFAGNTVEMILTRALLALIVCYPIGLAMGMVCGRIVREQARVLAETIEVGKRRGAAGVEMGEIINS